MLLAGLVATAALCVPDVRNYRHELLRPAWVLAAALWPAAIVISAIVERASVRRSRKLMAYAAATAVPAAFTYARFSDGLTWGALVPVVAVAHLCAAVVFEGLSQVALAPLRRFDDLGGAAGLWPIRLRLAALAVIGLAAAFPFAGEEYWLAPQRAAGRAEAEQDWANGRVACLVEWRRAYQPEWVGNAQIHSRFDARGLPLRARHWSEQSPVEAEAFVAGYRARIDQLVAERGPPPGAEPALAIDPTDLVRLLDTTDVVAISSFPHNPTPQVMVLRNAVAIDRPDRSLPSPFGGAVPPPARPIAGPEPIATGRVPGHPGVIFIRWGNRFVYVVTEDGRLVAEVVRW
jgi:hypothetical protein